MAKRVIYLGPVHGHSFSKRLLADGFVRIRLFPEGKKGQSQLAPQCPPARTASNTFCRNQCQERTWPGENLPLQAARPTAYFARMRENSGTGRSDAAHKVSFHGGRNP